MRSMKIKNEKKYCTVEQSVATGPTQTGCYTSGLIIKVFWDLWLGGLVSFLKTE